MLRFTASSKRKDGERNGPIWKKKIYMQELELQLDILAIEETEFNDSPAYESHELIDLGNDGYDVWDDVKVGVKLDLQRVREARAQEMGYVKSRKVYKYATRADAKEAGKSVIKTKWVDTNKGDTTNPNYRSRLVAMEFRRGHQADVFAATPPLESLRLLLSVFCDGVQRGRERGIREDSEERHGILVMDVRRAHFYAAAQRKIFIELPAEDPRSQDPEVCGELLQSLYGTRDASSNWEKSYSATMVNGGFIKGQASPCHFWHERWGVRCLVHGEDFVAVGSMRGLAKMKEHLGAAYECKSDIIGTGPKDAKELRVLGRIITVTEGGVLYEPDQRHAEAVIEALGLSSSSSCATPSVKPAAPSGSAASIRELRLGVGRSVNAEPSQREEAIQSRREVVDEVKAKEYLSLAAKLNYLAMDRCDLQYAAKELLRKASKPEEVDWENLKRVARYLIRAERMVQEFSWQRLPETLDVFVDSDFAGCHRTRRSTSGGVAVLGAHTLKAWSKTQAIIALSSAEAELGAMVKGSAEALGLKSLCEDFGIQMKLRIQSDATAAIGMVQREGLGKVRHLAVADLWIQNKRSSKEIDYVKIDGKLNPADILTKGVDGETLSRHVRFLGFRIFRGRHKLSLASVK